jgi:hypothetical protein
MRMDTKDQVEAQALANQVIDDLGGTAKTAILCDTSESAVSQWRVNGIPGVRLMYLKLARPDVFRRRRRKSPEPA